jgi:excisionase family DNA binding protein
MSRPHVLGPGVFVPADVCAEIGPGLQALRDVAKRDRRTLSADAVETLDKLELAGASWSERFPGVSSEVSPLDGQRFDPIEWISVTTVAAVLDISPQAVGRLLARGTLRGEKTGRTWRVDAASVDARREQCQ